MSGITREELRKQLNGLRILESDAELREHLKRNHIGEMFEDGLSERQVLETLKKQKFIERSGVNRSQDNTHMEFKYKESMTRYGKVIWRTSDEAYSTYDWYEFLD